MVKTILFGASKAGEEFLKKANPKRDFLAVVDNDEKKHGTIFFDLSIISPDEIKNFNYHEIIITSQYANEIKKQLIEDLHIEPAKIKIPPKENFKESHLPFEDEQTLDFARKIVKILASGACKQNLPMYIEYGTLLGIMRDGDLIPWDDDIDFAIIEGYEKELEDFLLKNVPLIDKNIGYKLKRRTLNGEIVSYHIYFYSNKYKFFTIEISIKNIKNTYAYEKSSLGKWFTPAYHLKKMDKINWQGKEIFIPYDYDNYLEFIYKNWKIPKKDSTFSEEEYNNCNSVPYNIIKDANFSMKTLIKNKIDNLEYGDEY